MIRHWRLRKCKGKEGEFNNEHVENWIVKVLSLNHNENGRNAIVEGQLDSRNNIQYVVTYLHYHERDFESWDEHKTLSPSNEHLDTATRSITHSTDCTHQIKKERHYNYI